MAEENIPAPTPTKQTLLLCMVTDWKGKPSLGSTEVVEESYVLKSAKGKDVEDSTKRKRFLSRWLMKKKKKFNIRLHNLMWNDDDTSTTRSTTAKSLLELHKPKKQRIMINIIFQGEIIATQDEPTRPSANLRMLHPHKWFLKLYLMQMLKTGVYEEKITAVRPDIEILNNLLTKNHSLENVIGDPSRPISTRNQLQEHAIWCYFDANDNPNPFGGKRSGGDLLSQTKIKTSEQLGSGIRLHLKTSEQLGSGLRLYLMASEQFSSGPEPQFMAPDQSPLFMK
ncbi:hypothetical protein Tco_1181693 [Tanacetum coccineum]